MLAIVASIIFYFSSFVMIAGASAVAITPLIPIKILTRR